jgi:2-oxoisovalerate dehydrogenase E1 component alpha subunit
LNAHTTSDDPTRYRIAGELGAWQAKDPITRMRRFLDKERLADGTFFAEVDEYAKDEALRLRERVLAMPEPEPLQLFDHVYAHGSALVDTERDRHAEYLASFAAEQEGGR